MASYGLGFSDNISGLSFSLPVKPETVGTRMTISDVSGSPAQFNKELFAPSDSHKDSFFFQMKGFSVEKKDLSPTCFGKDWRIAFF